jgi:hypothetical protein
VTRAPVRILFRGQLHCKRVRNVHLQRELTQVGVRLEKLMKSWFGTAACALVSGSAASLAMTAALALLAKKEGKGALQPINSTSHWLHGEEAGSVRSADVSHTALGYATHHVSALFWAVIFERWLAHRPERTPLLMLRDAATMSAIAAAVDYGITPKRATPGWEEVLSKRSIGVTYAAMALVPGIIID